MAKNGKNYKNVVAKLEAGSAHDLEAAVKFLKENSYVKFDETAEVAFRLGVNPTKSDQSVRGTVGLPH